MSEKLMALAQAVGARLRERGEWVVTAESCTGGGIAEVLTRIPGSSAWFDRAWVTYSNAAKAAELGVPAPLIAAHGAVSKEVVRAMAEGARSRVGRAWAVAVSGIAGPDGGSAAKPVGTVWLAWAPPGGAAVTAQDFLFQGGRDSVRRQSVEAALLGLKILLG